MQVVSLAKEAGKKTVCVSAVITEDGKKLGADLYIPLVQGEVTAEMTMADPKKYLINAGKQIKNIYEV